MGRRRKNLLEFRVEPQEIKETKQMRILVTGDRHWKDRTLVFYVLDQIHALTPITLIIEGGCRGADTYAGEWADSHSETVSKQVYDAKWNELGRSAGPIRNSEMLNKGRPERS